MYIDFGYVDIGVYCVQLYFYCMWYVQCQCGIVLGVVVVWVDYFLVYVVGVFVLFQGQFVGY